MNTIQITKRKSMIAPDYFTFKELQVLNPGVKYITLYYRIQALVRTGQVTTQFMKLNAKRGRSEVIFTFQHAQATSLEAAEPIATVTREAILPPLEELQAAL